MGSPGWAESSRLLPINNLLVKKKTRIIGIISACQDFPIFAIFLNLSGR